MLHHYPGSSSDSSDEMTLSDEDEKDGPDIPACTPLAAFLSFKQEAEKRRASQVQLEATGKVIKLCQHPVVCVWVSPDEKKRQKSGINMRH